MGRPEKRGEASPDTRSGLSQLPTREGGGKQQRDARGKKGGGGRRDRFRNGRRIFEGGGGIKTKFKCVFSCISEEKKGFSCFQFEMESLNL